MQKPIMGVIFGLLVAAPSIAFAAFDPEAATQTYLATLKGAARAKSDSYFEGGYWLLLWGALFAILADWLLLRFRWSARFRDWAERVTKRRFLQSMLYGVPYVVVSSLLLLPWTIYTGFVRERQYDFMNQSFVAWLGEQGISLAIGIVMLSLIIAMIFGGIRRAPKNWWIAGAGIAGVFMLIMFMLAPVFISPLFNTYQELPDGPVRDRIVSMAQSNGIPADHIYLFDQSKQHKRISANVSGFGPTMRISLNDNLLGRTTLPETASVMGHEMGHYTLGHGWKLVLGYAAIIGFCLWVASMLVPALFARLGPAWGLRGIDDVAAWPLYSIIMTAMMLVMTPVFNSLIRTVESQADAFGLEVAKEPDGFAQVALKLSEYRKIEPGKWEEIIFFDHPSGATRIRMAMDWKMRHSPKAAR